MPYFLSLQGAYCLPAVIFDMCTSKHTTLDVYAPAIGKHSRNHLVRRFALPTDSTVC